MAYFRDLLSLGGHPTEPLFGRRYGQAFGNAQATARALEIPPRAAPASAAGQAEPEPLDGACCPA